MAQEEKKVEKTESRKQMEDELTEVAENTMKKNNVLGFLCTDNSGLPLIVRGIAQAEMCNTLNSVMSKAAKLELEPGKEKPDPFRHPVVMSIDTDRGRIYAKKHSHTTTAIYMKYT